MDSNQRSQFAIGFRRRGCLPEAFAHWNSSRLYPPLAAAGSVLPSMCLHFGADDTKTNRHYQRKRTTTRVILFVGGDSWTRTNDPIDVNDVLYRLSHATMFFRTDGTIPQSDRDVKKKIMGIRPVTACAGSWSEIPQPAYHAADALTRTGSFR